jgi:hypothetical protein
MFNTVTPNIFQAKNFATIQSPLRSDDPLGAMDSQGQIIILDTHTDPIGALKSPFGGHPRMAGVIDKERMTAKLRDVFSLQLKHDPVAVEQARADKLRQI